MAEPNISQSIAVRFCISIAAILLPVFLLINGVFGSFLFTFSIPIIWQVCFLGKPIRSLGLRPNSIISSIIIGVISGLSLGFIGGHLLRSQGLSGQIFSSAHKLQFNLWGFHIAFPLQNELGYRLLTANSSAIGIFVYLAFCIFLIGLGEELFWRGFIQSKISSFFHKNMSIYITAILFALIHFYIFTILPIKPGVIFLVIIFIAGLIWGYLFKYFNNIWLLLYRMALPHSSFGNTIFLTSEVRINRRRLLLFGN